MYRYTWTKHIAISGLLYVFVCISQHSDCHCVSQYMGIHYTNSHLLYIKNNYVKRNFTLPDICWSTIHELGLYRPPRGFRAGISEASKVRNISVHVGRAVSEVYYHHQSHTRTWSSLIGVIIFSVHPGLKPEVGSLCSAKGQLWSPPVYSELLNIHTLLDALGQGLSDLLLSTDLPQALQMISRLQNLVLNFRNYLKCLLSLLGT